MHPERITLKDKEFVNDLNYDRVGLAVRKKKDSARLKQKTGFALVRFAMKVSWFFQSTFRTKHLKIQWICCL